MKSRFLYKFIASIIFLGLVTFSLYSFADDSAAIATNANGAAQNSNTVIPVDDINNFAKVYAITKNYYVESVADTKLMHGAINGMLTNLDPHSNYLDQTEFKALSEMTNGSFAGIGIEIGRDKDAGGVKVIAPIYGTPAYMAGVKSGDVIIKIDGQQSADMSIDDAVKKMRGKAGSKVTIVVSRKSEIKPLTFTITRSKIEIKSVKSTIIANNYGYVRITAFQSDTPLELSIALKNLYKTNTHLKGLILDLRDDPGGVLQAAVGAVGAFVPQDSLVVYTKGRAPDSNQKYYVKPSDYLMSRQADDVLADIPTVFKTIPMVIMVNQGTASASEIVAGALQDYKRGKIIGTQTFGKGSVQTVIPLSEDTAIKLTTALYYTPKGRSIQAQGIKPDIIVKSEYNDLLDSWDLSEANLGHHLDNPNSGNGISVTKDKDNTPILTPAKQISTQAELKARMKSQIKQVPKVVNQSEAIVDLKTDFQLEWALNIVEGKPLPESTK